MNQHYRRVFDEIFTPEHRARMRAIYEEMAKEADEYLEQNGGKTVNDDTASIAHKTAFLSELKGLLEEYGYSISSGINFGESDTYKAFGGMGFISSDESRDIDYNPKYGCITPDNIMDWEKE